MLVHDDDDVEVLYDIPYGNGNANGNAKKNRGNRGANSQNRIISNHVAFENVFDPFERDNDDVREFFDDSSDKNYESNDDWEKPTMFNDPRKVREKNSFKTLRTE
jgi:hypothetical protein